jgi:hypothetical protein
VLVTTGVTVTAFAASVSRIPRTCSDPFFFFHGSGSEGSSTTSISGTSQRPPLRHLCPIVLCSLFHTILITPIADKLLQNPTVTIGVNLPHTTTQPVCCAILDKRANRHRLADATTARPVRVAATARITALPFLVLVGVCWHCCSYLYRTAGHRS